MLLTSFYQEIDANSSLILIKVRAFNLDKGGVTDYNRAMCIGVFSAPKYLFWR